MDQIQVVERRMQKVVSLDSVVRMTGYCFLDILKSSRQVIDQHCQMVACHSCSLQALSSPCIVLEKSTIGLHIAVHHVRNLRYLHKEEI